MAQPIGKICENYEEKEIEWKITDISPIIACEKNIISSPYFSFADSNLWLFGLQTKYPQKPEFICLYLGVQNSQEFSVEYSYGVKKLDGNVEHLGRGIFKGDRSRWSKPCCIMKLSELQERKFELAPSNVLTFTCMLKRRTTPSPEMLDEPKFKKLKKLDTLSDNLKDLFTNKESCDTTLLVKDREYRVHRAILIARSYVFAAMFRHDTKEKQTNVVTIRDCDPESFEVFLEYLYCGKLEVSSSSCALHLYKTSEKYNVQELKAFCTEYLMENLTLENLCDTLVLANQYDDTKLFFAVQEFFNKNLHEMFQSSEFICLMKNNLHLAKKLFKRVPKGTVV